MKTKPFSTKDVQAFLEGRKTMFREVVSEKLLNKYYDYDEYCNAVMPSDIPCSRSYEKDYFIQHPKFQVGDIIGVKETWFATHFNYKDLLEVGINHCIKYKADNNYDPVKDCVGRKWHSPVTMPREAIRLFLEVTGVKVKKFREITEDEAMKEGYETSVFYNTSRKRIESFHPIEWNANNWHFVYECKRIEKPNNL